MQNGGLTSDQWLTLLLFVLSGLCVLMLVFITTMKSSLSQKQTDIWDWAKDETKEIRHDILRDHEKMELRISDLNRYIRHSERDLWQMMVHLARAIGPEGDAVIKTVERKMSRGD